MRISFLIGVWIALSAVAALARDGHVELSRVERSDEDHRHIHRELRAHHTDVLLQVGQGRNSLGENMVAHDKMLKPVKLKNWGYTQFVGSIEIGKPSQNFRVIYDTGSSNTWLPGHQCEEASCDKYGKYDHRKSRTFSRMYTQEGLGESRRSKFYIKYGSGLVKGKVVQDDVRMGGITLKKARFGEVGYEHGHAFRKGHFSGIVGLAYPSLAAANMYPLFDQVIDQKVLAKDEFAFYLSNSIKRPSKLMLGDSAEGSWKGDLTHHNVIESNYWAIRMADVMVGDERLHVCPSHGCKVAVDSGTSLVTGPSGHVSKLLSKLDIDHGCSNWDDIKSMSLLLEASREDGSKYLKKYPLHKNEFVFEMKNKRGERKACTPGVMALDVPQPRGPLWILGDLFMMKYFTQYDRATNQVKMGEANHRDKMQTEEAEEEAEVESMLSRTMEEVELEEGVNEQPEVQMMDQ
jgi:cathepsin D